MTVYVGLLRAINVGGTAPVRMGTLQELLSSMGHRDVRTVLQSGNVVFRSSSAEPASLERRLEGELARGFGRPIEMFVRTREEWHEVLVQNPFPREAEADPSHLLVTLLKSAPTVSQWTALRQSIRGRERVSPAGRHLYVVYPDGVGRSKLSPAVIERAVGTHGTSRNWNTVRRLDLLAAS